MAALPATTDGARLASDWVRTARRAGSRGDLAEVGGRVLARYAEPHRSYHGVRHLAEVLAAVERLAPYAERADDVRLAAWFHDAVYDPSAGDNEEASAAWAEQVLADLRVPPPTVASVARLVRLTATHDPAPLDRDGIVLCDADLAVLAGDASRYAEYVAGVRREYAHLDDETFTAGRRAVLAALLARGPLYGTEHGQVQWEARARDNMARELGALSGTG